MKDDNAFKYDIAFWTGYYEDDKDYFEWASNKAYLDMNRTLTFLKSNKDENDVATEREKWRNVGTEIIRKRFEEMNGDFDIWHKQACDELISYYNEGNKLVERNTQNKTTLTYGQAQKWLNMTLKYLWLLNRLGLLNEEDAAIIKNNQQHFHVPLDSYILRYVAKRGKSKTDKFPENSNGLNSEISFEDEWKKFGSTWSQINDVNAYIGYQVKLSNAIKGQSPLEWELVHWHKALKYYDSTPQVAIKNMK